MEAIVIYRNFIGEIELIITIMRKVILTILLVTTCTVAMAKSGVRDKMNFVRTQFDINWAIPKGFKAEKWDKIETIYGTVKSTESKVAAGNVYWMGAASADGNCRLLYQMVYMLAAAKEAEKVNVFDTFVKHELYSAVNGGYYIHEREEMKPEWNKYLTITSGEEARTAYNADSVYVVDFPNVSPAIAKGYNHCVGLYLCRSGHMPIIVMCLLNDAGYQQKDKYVAALRQAVRYGDREWKYNREEADAAYNKIQASW